MLLWTREAADSAELSNSAWSQQGTADAVSKYHGAAVVGEEINFGSDNVQVKSSKRHQCVVETERHKSDAKKRLRTEQSGS